MDASRMDLIMPTFLTVNYKNAHYNRVMMIPSSRLKGARVICDAQPFYKEFLGEADDEKALALRAKVEECVKDFDAIIESNSATLEEQQEALMMQAYTLHLLAKMVI